MREVNFQWEMHAAFTHHYPDAYYYKIPDPTRAEAHRPYDAEFFQNGKYWGLEYKMMKKVEAFPFSHIEDHQIFNLRKIHRNGGFGYFIINYRTKVTEKQRKLYDIEEKKLNVAYVIPITYILQVMKLGARSVSVKWLRTYAMKMDRETIEKGLTLWNVRTLIERDRKQ